MTNLHIDWKNLKNMRCPKCNRCLILLSEKLGGGFYCQMRIECGFKIGKSKFEEVVNDLYKNPKRFDY